MIAIGLMALGVLHGVVLWVALWRLRPLNPVGYANLIVGVSAVMAIILEEMLVYNGGWRTFPHAVRATTWAPFLIGPSVWLFVKSLDHPEPRKTVYAHYLPAFLAFLYFTPFYVMSGADKIAVVQNTQAIPLDLSVMGGLKAASLFGYFITVRISLSRMGAVNRSRLTLRIARAVSLSLAFFALIVIGFAGEHIWGELPLPSDTVGAVGLALFIYVLSLITLADWRDFALTRPLETAAEAAAPGAASRTVLLDEDTARTLYEEAEKTVVSRGLYREPGLRVEALSAAVGLPPHYFSYVINSQSGLNVQSWLNRLRVAHAGQALLDDPDKPVLEIGLEAGFNSKAAFNRAFKAVTGKTPSDYRLKASQIVN